MKKKIVYIVLALLLLLGISYGIYYYIYPNMLKEYPIGGDFVPSIASIVDDHRIVYRYSKQTKDHVLTKKFLYKNIDNVEQDLQTYTNYLLQFEQFSVLKPYDLKDIKQSSIYLGKVSHLDENYIVVVAIDYTADQYQITITRKKGTILPN